MIMSMQGPSRPKPRVLEADRSQLRLVTSDLERMVPEDHQVRAVWAYVNGLDLAPFYARIRAVEGHAGRPPVDPRILLSLWLEATLDGIGSARELERMTREHIAYQWICGGVEVGYHTLSDFRSESGALFDHLLTDSVVRLLREGLVTLERVSQDGMKVRASAGAGSFRRRETLERLTREVKAHVETLRGELDADPGAGRARREAARRRAAADREERIKRALASMPEAERRKKSRNGKTKTAPRVSTTDPQARVMKMADGGFRPAFNVHAVTDTGSQVIVAVDVNDHGTDQNSMRPLAAQVRRRYGAVPREWLADGGCVTHQNIETLSSDGYGCQVLGPVRVPRGSGYESTEVRPTDSAAIAAWRTRMASDYGKAAYRERGATSECVNAAMRQNGLLQFLVRGIRKAYSVVCLHALAHNMRRSFALG